MGAGVGLLIRIPGIHTHHLWQVKHSCSFQVAPLPRGVLLSVHKHKDTRARTHTGRQTDRQADRGIHTHTCKRENEVKYSNGVQIINTHMLTKPRKPLYASTVSVSPCGGSWQAIH